MSVFWAWVIVGIVAGWLTRIMAPGEGRDDVVGDLVVGVIGALLAGWMFTSYGQPGVGGSIVMAYAGAVVFLWGLRVLTRSRARI
jgi:uncharacterized membrane protein YeaQ/YmgE (transglycosylase-associated protein family)